MKTVAAFLIEHGLTVDRNLSIEVIDDIEAFGKAYAKECLEEAKTEFERTSHYIDPLRNDSSCVFIQKLIDNLK